LMFPTAKDGEGERVVAVIDDDESVREALRGLFQSVGLVTEIYGSVQAFLDAGRLERAGCIVLDIRLSERSGLEFQEALARSGAAQSVVLISGHVDVQMAVRAMKAGAVDVLTKPVREQDLLEAVNRALAADQHRREETKDDQALRARHQTLSERERQVFALVAAGLLNKQIADRVAITEATVKLHRGQVMKKMGAISLADLVRMADRFGQSRSGPGALSGTSRRRRDAPPRARRPQASLRKSRNRPLYCAGFSFIVRCEQPVITARRVWPATPSRRVSWQSRVTSSNSPVVIRVF